MLPSAGLGFERARARARPEIDHIKARLSSREARRKATPQSASSKMKESAASTNGVGKLNRPFRSVSACRCESTTQASWQDVSSQLSEIHGCLGNLVSDYLRSFGEGCGPAAIMRMQVDHASYLEVLEHTLLNDADRAAPSSRCTHDWYAKFDNMRCVLADVERTLTASDRPASSSHSVVNSNADSPANKRSASIDDDSSSRRVKHVTFSDTSSRATPTPEPAPVRQRRTLIDLISEEELSRCERQLLSFLSVAHGHGHGHGHTPRSMAVGGTNASKARAQMQMQTSATGPQSQFLSQSQSLIRRTRPRRRYSVMGNSSSYFDHSHVPLDLLLSSKLDNLELNSIGSTPINARANGT